MERQTTPHSLAASVPTSQLAPTIIATMEGCSLMLFQACAYCLVSPRLTLRSHLTPPQLSVRIFQAEGAKLLQELSIPNIVELQFSPRGTYISTWERPGTYKNTTHQPRVHYIIRQSVSYPFPTVQSSSRTAHSTRTSASSPPPPAKN